MSAEEEKEWAEQLQWETLRLFTITAPHPSVLQSALGREALRLVEGWIAIQEEKSCRRRAARAAAREEGEGDGAGDYDSDTEGVEPRRTVNGAFSCCCRFGALIQAALTECVAAECAVAPDDPAATNGRSASAVQEPSTAPAPGANSNTSECVCGQGGAHGPLTHATRLSARTLVAAAQDGLFVCRSVMGDDASFAILPVAYTAIQCWEGSAHGRLGLTTPAPTEGLTQAEIERETLRSDVAVACRWGCRIALLIALRLMKAALTGGAVWTAEQQAQLKTAMRALLELQSSTWCCGLGTRGEGGEAEVVRGYDVMAALREVVAALKSFIGIMKPLSLLLC